MKKIAKKNLKLDKEVIASLSENEMSRIAGGDKPEKITDIKGNCAKTVQAECTVVPYTKAPCITPVTEQCDEVPGPGIETVDGTPCNAVATNPCPPNLTVPCTQLTISCVTVCC